MLPKAGVFAHGEAEVVAKRIASELAGDQPIANSTAGAAASWNWALA